LYSDEISCGISGQGQQPYGFGFRLGLSSSWQLHYLKVPIELNSQPIDAEYHVKQTNNKNYRVASNYRSQYMLKYLLNPAFFEHNKQVKCDDQQSNELQIIVQ